MAIVVFQHHESERPGRLGLTLRDHAFKLDVRRLDRGDAVPTDLDDVDGVISLGGPQSVGGREAWLEKEVGFLKEAMRIDLPVIGVCLGAQLIAAALGGTVGPMEAGPEAGFDDVTMQPAGHVDPILAGIAWKSPQFHIHNDEVKGVPPGATLLASSRRCPVQAFRAGFRTYAFQYHFECDREMVVEMAGENRLMLGKAGLNPEEVARQCDRNYQMYARLGDRLCMNIVTYLFPRVGAAVGR
ncbi:MAG: type 1 glutamine amidotransferase [Planctomycetota bacterium]|nr:type 1 glutamine amidotransferase [Planctomycetota bacterium]